VRPCKAPLDPLLSTVPDAVLPQLKAMTAASVQLSVPVITAMGGAFILYEPITLRVALASAAILGGIAVVIRASPSLDE
jgi:drug/metabolite transporter (DMT)-like permease